MISAGELTRRITLRTMVRTSDGGGGYTETPQDIATTWAKVEPLEGREQLAAMQTGMQRPHRFTIRYRTDIEGTTEVLYDGNRYDVTSVIDVDAARREIQILADKVVA